MPTALNDLTFHIDLTHANSPVSTGYEPISRSAVGTADEVLWVNDFLNSVSHDTSAGYLTDMYQWDHDTRVANDTEWAYTVFVVDSSADDDGAFSNGPFAYTYLGGPFLVMTYDNQTTGIADMGRSWPTRPATSSTRWMNTPGTASYTDHSGYYNTQNLNAYEGNPDPGSRVESLMSERASMTAAYANHTSSPSSLEMVGWKDSDGDGLLDVLDVPLTLDGTGFYNTGTGQWEFTGTSRRADAAQSQSSWFGA